MDNPYRQNEERSLKDLSPGVEALLCYVGGWISGIVFLVLEQKNRTIRFHALQSIVVFGILSVAIAVFGAVPLIGGGFASALGIVVFILWIILMVKALNGEYFKMPWAGELAERLTNESFSQTTRTETHQRDNIVNSSSPSSAPPSRAEEPPSTAEAPRQATPSPERPSKGSEFKAKYYSGSRHAARIAGSAFAIAWSVVLLVFFNFYRQYIAYYEPAQNGTNTWNVHTLVTGGYSLWLPILTTTLILTIIGHAFLIAVDKYLLRQTIRIILDAFGAAVVITLLVIFPFNFSVIPNHFAADGATLGVTIALIFGAIGFVIGAIVRFITLIVHLVEGKF
jgi:uncharacterized membrane protein